MSSFTRRRFVQGAAGGVGLLTVGGGLRYLEHAAPAQAEELVGKETVFRTGHSNNCDGACGHLVKVVDGRIRLIQGAPWSQKTISGHDAPKYDPRVCLRGVAQIQNTYSPDRVKYPYQRVGERGSGQWRRISWDDATSLIAEKFQAIQKEHGKKSVWVAPYTGSLSILEGVVGAGFRFASVIGASAGDFEGDSEGDSSTPAGWNYLLADPDKTAGGIFDGHESVDFLNSKLIVLWANNVAETSLPDWRIIAQAQRNGATVVSIDPRFTPTSAKSDIWLPIRPGADTALIDGIMNQVIQKRRYDADYMKKYTVGPFLVHPDTKKFLRDAKGHYLVVDSDGQVKPIEKAHDPELLGEHDAGGVAAKTAFQLLADEMAPYTPEKVASMTDLDPRQVLQLAGLWADNQPTGVRAGFGLSHWYRGDLTMQALLTLQAMTGNIGVHGGGVTTFAGGLTTTAFDLGNWWAPKGTEMFTVLEPMEACDAMLHDKPYPVRAAWFMVDNFAQQMSDRNLVIKALKSLDFMVVSDYVLSATADLADVVLPACTYLEKTDLLSSNNFYLQYMPKVIEPLWESKSDLEAITLVAAEDGRRQVLRPVGGRLPEGDPPHRRSEGGRQRQRTELGAAHDVGAAPEHADHPVRPVLRQGLPDEVGTHRVLRREAASVRPAAPRLQGADRGHADEPALQEVSAHLPQHAYTVPDALAVREPAVAQGGEQRRRRLPRDQPEGRAAARDRRR